jgi:hypothetical protein
LLFYYPNLAFIQKLTIYNWCMDKTVIGIFEPTTNTEHLINDLQADGYNPRDVSIVMRDRNDVEGMHETTGAEVLGDTAGGLATGAVVGGIMGLLAAIAIPGVGGILVGGPIAAALGLTGVAATAASGAVTGAIAGGLIGALMGLGLPREEAERYQERIKEGAILVAVPASDAGVLDVESLFRDYQAMEVKILTHESRDWNRRRSTDERSQYGFASKGGRSRRRR